MSTRPAKWLFHVSGFLSLVVFGVLAWQSRQQIPTTLVVFGGICLAGFLLSLTAAWGAHQGRVSFLGVFVWCVLLRVVAVGGEPIYEDDYYRYLWDGRQTIEQGSPYTIAPADAFESEDDPIWVEVLDNVNNPELHTIYGPVNQYVFAIGYLLIPGEVGVLQFIFACVDLLVILLLCRLASLWAVVLYGFSPLVLKEFSFTAHPDVLSVFGLLLATWAWQRGRLYSAALALALAVSAKLFAFILVPLLLRWHWRSWLVFVLVTALLHLPLVHFAGMGEALSAMANYWLFNAPIYYLLYQHVDLQVIKVTLVLVFLSICAGYFLLARYHTANPPQIPRADVLYMAMMLALPAFNPWYYVFVLVYAAIYPSLWAWVGSLTVLFAYAIGLQLETHDLDPYQQPVWGLVAEFLPIFVAAAIPPLVRRYHTTADSDNEIA